MAAPRPRKPDRRRLRTFINEFPEHIFVIPSKVLLKSYFTTVMESSVIYLPTEKLAEYLNQRPRVDFWQYENAWHLLPRTFWSAY